MVAYTLAISLVIVISTWIDPTGKYSQKLSRAWSWMALKVAGATVTVEGGENIDLSGPRIYICNHQS